MRTLMLLALLVLPACAPPPPTLSPQATMAYRATQVIRSLDLVRDTAIAANEQVPPLISTATTRRVVLAHKSLITVAHASQAGWSQAVQAGLTELTASLVDTERAQLVPYLTLTQTLLKELP